MPQRIVHGSLVTPVLTADRVRRSLSQLDEGELVYMCNARNIFNPGAEAPGFPNMRIHEVDERTIAGDIEASLRVSGLMEGNSRIISTNWQEDPFGFDTVNVEKIERSNAASVAWGTALANFSNMRYLGGAEDDELDGRWMRRALTYRGIRRTGLYHRRVSVNENIVNPADPITVSLPGGWPVTPRKSSVSLPRIVVAETIKNTLAPDTNGIPGMVGTPISGLAFPTIQNITITGSDLTYNYPYGWKLASIDSEQLYTGVSIYVHTYTYEYVWTASF